MFVQSTKKEEAPMPLNDIWDLFQKRVFPIQSTEILFNQYKDSDPIVDLPNASNIRKQNLKNYLESFPERPYILVVGEAAGPWGCRFSGVPFTGEKQLCMHALPFQGHRSSKEKPLLETKKMPPYTSQSAETFWRVMKPYHPEFFVWDCVPFHPHDPDKILSIRSPKLEEVGFYSELLKEIIEIIKIKPRHIVAVGRKAELGLRLIGVRPIYVRHPSCGGAREFRTRLARELARMK